ncbi:MAG: caspase family protein, partial [Pseudomonadota bacterium]
MAVARSLLWGLLAAFLAAVVMAGVAPVQGQTKAQAERRVALVIGNNAYEHATRLPNTVNDADAIAKALTALRFD